jgi:hypothetical protein
MDYVDKATREWFESELERIAAGRVPLISERNVRYVYANPDGDSSGIEATSSGVDANTCRP